MSVLLVALGGPAIVIGLSIFLLGGAATLAATENLLGPLLGATERSGAISPTMDSELRFYAALWIAYGAVLVFVARRLRTHFAWVPLLVGVFFAGGVGRALAFVASGPPHPAFTLLMLVELVLPLVFLVLWWAARGAARAPDRR